MITFKFPDAIRTGLLLAGVGAVAFGLTFWWVEGRRPAADPAVQGISDLARLSPIMVTCTGPPPLDEPVGWRRYHDPRQCVTFLYPAAWRLEAEHDQNNPDKVLFVHLLAPGTELADGRLRGAKVTRGAKITVDEASAVHIKAVDDLLRDPRVQTQLKSGQMRVLNREPVGGREAMEFTLDLPGTPDDFAGTHVWAAANYASTVRLAAAGDELAHPAHAVYKAVAASYRVYAEDLPAARGSVQ